MLRDIRLQLTFQNECNEYRICVTGSSCTSSAVCVWKAKTEKVKDRVYAFSYTMPSPVSTHTHTHSYFTRLLRHILLVLHFFTRFKHFTPLYAPSWRMQEAAERQLTPDPRIASWSGTPLHADRWFHEPSTGARCGDLQMQSRVQGSGFRAYCSGRV